MKAALCIIAAFLLTAMSSTIRAAAGHMEAALELLQSAKKSENPMPMLIAAKKHFQAAKKNKGGALAQAAETLNEAIALAELKGDKKKLEQKINATIANVQNGIGNAK